ncbi:hypothetical protein U732_3449 [Clostridium argentinense CDC 2741]|uniref:DUF2268 domain-containing protein n=1 Tax=Clostridium argentinense CDC 2741 TaxID=1418104 RepID=A0A0C1UGN3_9CLOT|nr:hypothetical protein [Clostridium argentinense]ARC86369.1 hypothetical protein RSJ17_18690 [Clostridium argentinense]KIE46545.1 hypothetical protein U732_3449 [Clostridium argentinense CDC 2741]NFF41382.1 hypothetical protein [Clostridium argentinense]NFP49942.1 hypothetical protein [Clostridium argentinense]NFP71218.1 hypothetical protein [Clostridium argentinense]
MIVNDDIIIKYFNNTNCDDYNKHWVFDNIEENQYLFEKPLCENKDIVQDVYKKIKCMLNEFTPVNEKLFRRLFPNFQEVLKRTKVILVVGCPNPYDAMVREYNKEAYVIFDLIRLGEYIKNGHNLENIIQQLLTHEFAHKCIREKYRINDNLSYIEKLNYITFDEGFAHLLSYKEDIENYNFNSEIYIEKFNKSKKVLAQSINEKEIKEQERLLLSANSGAYWDKFASICGKLYLAKHIDSLLEIYEKGWNNIITDILKE